MPYRLRSRAHGRIAAAAAATRTPASALEEPVSEPQTASAASLGGSSEREAVEMALDLVSFRKELLRGTRALLDLKLSRID